MPYPTLPRRPVALTALILGCMAAAQTVAAREPSKPPLELSFQAFFATPVGPRGLQLSNALTAADGHEVRIVGFMVAQERATAGRFLLTPMPLRLSEHADGEASDLPPSTVTVQLDPGQRSRVVAHQPGPIALVGRLQVGREADADGRVSWIRLQLPPEAVAPGEATTVAPGVAPRADARTHAH